MKKIYLLVFIALSFCSKSCAFGEEKSYWQGETTTEITSILSFSINDQGDYVIYGLNRKNQLLKQIISNNPKIDNKETVIIHNFDTTIKSEHIAISNSQIAYIKDSSVFVIDTKSDDFCIQKTRINELKNSNLLLLKIIDNDAQIFCKEGHNNYFICRVSNKKIKQIKFNFAPGTYINNFEIENGNYLISGYIKDPALGDQYAFFTQTDLKGKMIWEKQEGELESVSLGYDMDIDKSVLFLKNEDIFLSTKGLFRKKNIKALKMQTDKNNTKHILLLCSKDSVTTLGFLRVKNNTQQIFNIDFYHLQNKQDSLTSELVDLTQDTIYPFLFTTKNRYKKGDGFQLKLSNKEDYNFHIVSFSSNKKIDKFYPKALNIHDSILILPSKNTKFDKLDDNEEYLLLLYDKNKGAFINLDKWDKGLINNMLLFIAMKTENIDYYRKRSSAISISIENTPTIIPLLIKVKSVNYKIDYDE